MHRLIIPARCAFGQCRRSLFMCKANQIAAPAYKSAPKGVPASILARPFSNSTRRFNTALSIPENQQKANTTPAPPPSYQLTFTCKPCGHRSAHMVSKQGYHHGTVLISCPSCKNRHVISDHLKIFMDEKSTLEDILRRTAADGDLSKLLKKGKLGMRQGALVGNEGEEDIEFWEDGSETQRQPTDKSTTDTMAQG